MCMEYLLAYRYVYITSVPCTCLVPEGSRKGYWISWNWHYRQQQDIMWVL